MVRLYRISFLFFFLCLPFIAVTAGGPEITQPIYSGIYLEGDLGYAGIDWRNFALAPANFTAAASPSTNTVGGFSYGFDLGYEFNQYFSLEIGWLDLPIVRGTVTGIAATAVAGSAYGDGKFTLPIFKDTLYFFSKVGTIYRYTRLTANAPVFVGDTLIPINGRYWTVLFAVGCQYYFIKSWSVHVQYTRAPGYYLTVPAFTTTRLDVPPANIVTVGIGYKIIF